jgi:hypothetical protein
LRAQKSLHSAGLPAAHLYWIPSSCISNFESAYIKIEPEIATKIESAANRAAAAAGGADVNLVWRSSRMYRKNSLRNLFSFEARKRGLFTSGLWFNKMRQHIDMAVLKLVTVEGSAYRKDRRAFAGLDAPGSGAQW